MKFRRYVRLLCALLLAGLWLTTASWAELVSAEFILCEPAQSPCCPQPSNNNEGSCPACLVANNVARQESQQQEREQKQQERNLPHGFLSRESSPSSALGLRREFERGFRYQPRVFDLKDDLRI